MKTNFIGKVMDIFKILRSTIFELITFYLESFKTQIFGLKMSDLKIQNFWTFLQMTWDGEKNKTKVVDIEDTYKLDM